MLTKTHRFHGSASLQFVLRRGKTFRQPDLALRCIHNKKSDQFRVAVIVSKKVHKSAVKRNRIRRRIFAGIQDYTQRINTPHDIVFLVYKDSLLSLPQEELKRQLTKLLTLAGVI